VQEMADPRGGEAGCRAAAAPPIWVFVTEISLCNAQPVRAFVPGTQWLRRLATDGGAGPDARPLVGDGPEGARCYLSGSDIGATAST
jgi:hypothetical protein